MCSGAVVLGGLWMFCGVCFWVFWVLFRAFVRVGFLSCVIGCLGYFGLFCDFLGCLAYFGLFGVLGVYFGFGNWGCCGNFGFWVSVAFGLCLVCD